MFQIWKIGARGAAGLGFGAGLAGASVAGTVAQPFSASRGMPWNCPAATGRARSANARALVHWVCLDIARPGTATGGATQLRLAVPTKPGTGTAGRLTSAIPVL